MFLPEDAAISSANFNGLCRLRSGRWRRLYYFCKRWLVGRCSRFIFFAHRHDLCPVSWIGLFDFFALGGIGDVHCC